MWKYRELLQPQNIFICMNWLHYTRGTWTLSYQTSKKGSERPFNLQSCATKTSSENTSAVRYLLYTMISVKTQWTNMLCTDIFSLWLNRISARTRDNLNTFALDNRIKTVQKETLKDLCTFSLPETLQTELHSSHSTF